MGVAGVVEFAVGAAIPGGWTRLGAYVASGWLLGVSANLVAAGFYDIAVRDAVMSCAAFTLARLAEVREQVPAPPIQQHRRAAGSSGNGLTGGAGPARLSSARVIRR